jgi:hypothetical protein
VNQEGKKSQGARPLVLLRRRVTIAATNLRSRPPE